MEVCKFVFQSFTLKGKLLSIKSAFKSSKSYFRAVHLIASTQYQKIKIFSQIFIMSKKVSENTKHACSEKILMRQKNWHFLMFNLGQGVIVKGRFSWCWGWSCSLWCRWGCLGFAVHFIRADFSYNFFSRFVSCSLSFSTFFRFRFFVKYLTCIYSNSDFWNCLSFHFIRYFFNNSLDRFFIF